MGPKTSTRTRRDEAAPILAELREALREPEFMGCIAGLVARNRRAPKPEKR